MGAQSPRPWWYCTVYFAIDADLPKRDQLGKEFVMGPIRIEVP